MGRRGDRLCAGAARLVGAGAGRRRGSLPGRRRPDHRRDRLRARRARHRDPFRPRPSLRAGPPRHMSFCLAAAGLAVEIVAASFTLAWTHTIEKTVWEEDWRVEGDR